MSSDLRTVLSRAADDRVADLDVDLVIRTGRRRRVRVLATQAVAGVAALALLGSVGLTLLPGDERAVTLGAAPAGLQVPDLPSEVAATRRAAVRAGPEAPTLRPSAASSDQTGPRTRSAAGRACPTRRCSPSSTPARSTSGTAPCWSWGAQRTARAP